MCLHGLDTRAKNVFKVKKKKIRGRKSPLIEKNLRQYKEDNISVSESLPWPALRQKMQHLNNQWEVFV